jgi:hypothetical protein
MATQKPARQATRPQAAARPAQRPAPAPARRPAAAPARRPPPPPPQQEPVDDGWESAESSDLADQGFGGGLVDEGGYQCTIDKAYFRTSNSSGKDYVNIDLEIIEGDFAGRHLFCPLYINSDSDNFRKGQKGFLRKFFEVCVGTAPDAIPQADDDLADLVGTACWVYATVEDNDDGKGGTVEVNRVIRVRDPSEAEGGGGEAATDDPDPQAQAEEQQPAPAARRPARAAAPAAGRKPAGGSFDDLEDDIPF